MIKGLVIALACMVFLCASTNSQQLSHQVLVPVAGVATKGSINYSQTIGEAVVKLTGSDEYLLTQGFQQPRIKNQVDNHIYTEIKVYPNPAHDYIRIDLFGDGPMTFRIEIMDILGTVVYTENKVFHNSFRNSDPRDISHLHKGFYVVNITSSDRKIRRALKIEKI